MEWLEGQGWQGLREEWLVGLELLERQGRLAQRERRVQRVLLLERLVRRQGLQRPLSLRHLQQG